MKSLCKSRIELSRKDLMGEQTLFWGQASTKECARCGAPKIFHTVSSRTGGRVGGTVVGPTPSRQTPIATTALGFIVGMGPEGAISVRLSRGRGARGGGEGGAVDRIKTIRFCISS